MLKALTFLIILLLIPLQSFGLNQPNSLSDLGWYIKALQRELETSKEQLNKVKEDKGFDAEASRLISESISEIRAIEAKLQEMQTKKMANSQVLLNMSIIKERRGVLRDNLVALGIMMPYGPKHFPERCVFYKSDIPERGDELAMKEGLEKRVGKIENQNDALVFATPDRADPSKILGYHLDANMGVIGSEDPAEITAAKQPTPENMSITAWIDVESHKVMCVTHPIEAAHPSP
jgi:hypothetical protein